MSGYTSVNDRLVLSAEEACFGVVRPQVRAFRKLC